MLSKLFKKITNTKESYFYTVSFARLLDKDKDKFIHIPNSMYGKFFSEMTPYEKEIFLLLQGQGYIVHRTKIELIEYYY